MKVTQKLNLIKFEYIQPIFKLYYFDACPTTK